MPSEEEVARVRRLVARIRTSLDDLTPEERAQADDAVATVRRHRSVMVGMPRVRPRP